MSKHIDPLTIEEVAEECRNCKKCPLYLARTTVVPGEGNSKAKVIFIGEAPGEEEDLQGKPFVGKAGQLLTRILQSIEIKREDIFITNMVKCRPPGNRNPSKSEIETCYPYLETQIALINPKIIVTLGNVPTQYLLETTQGITDLRGQWQDWIGKIKIFPMFHPSYLLRNEGTFPSCQGMVLCHTSKVYIYFIKSPLAVKRIIFSQFFYILILIRQKF